MEIVARNDGPNASPIREYARNAVDAIARDQRQGVLIWRIANHLVGQIRELSGRPDTTLDTVKPNEREFYVRLAQQVYALTVSIDSDAPPSPGEIYRYEQRKQLALARAKARMEAARLNHEIDVFRPSEPGYELALCRRCSGGVSIHLSTAGVSVSDRLARPCLSR